MSEQIMDLLKQIDEGIKELNKKADIIINQNLNRNITTIPYKGVNRIKSIIDSANKTKANK